MTTQIEIIHKKESTIIRSSYSDLSFSHSVQPIVSCHASGKLTSPMIDDLEQSGIVSVEEVDYEKGFIKILPKSFYSIEKMTDVFVFVFEKYNL